MRYLRDYQVLSITFKRNESKICRNVFQETGWVSLRVTVPFCSVVFVVAPSWC